MYNVHGWDLFWHTNSSFMKRRYTLLVALMIIVLHGYAMKPKRDYIVTPDSLGMKYTELQLTTSDNYQINTWVMRPDAGKDNKTVMIVAYGDAMNMSYWVEQCYYFVQAGFTVITFDYRGFGHSSPFALDSNQLYYNEFALDLGSVIKYAQSEFRGYKVGVRALSMGTAIATISFSSTPFDYFIGDSFVCDPVAMQDRLRKITGRTFAIPKGAENYKSFLDNISIPMLVFSGTKDENTPLSECKPMVALHANRKLITYDGGHLQGIFVLSGKTFGAAYIKDVKVFLKLK